MSPLIATPGSLHAVMNGLEVLEQEVIAQIRSELGDEVHFYRWRPRGSLVELPALYNWLTPSGTTDQPSVGEIRDTITIGARIAISYSDVTDEMASLEQYADIFRGVVDPPLLKAMTSPGGTSALSGAATRSYRAGMNTVSESFNNIPSLAIEFPIVVQLRRLIR